MDTSREALLQPTLGRDVDPQAAPYSMRATFLSGFFGGPFAAMAMIVLSSVRLRRLHKDWPALLVCLITVLCLGWALYGSGAGFDPLRDWLFETLGESQARLAYRALSLAIIGMGYLLHRREQRSAELLELPRPNGWVAGLLCLAGGVVAWFGMVAVISVIP